MGIFASYQTHQLRWDGGGYPNGHKDEEIPLEARIIAVADIFINHVLPSMEKIIN